MLKVSMFNNYYKQNGILFIFNSCTDSCACIKDEELVHLVEKWEAGSIIAEKDYAKDFIHDMVHSGYWVDASRDEHDYVNFIYSRFLSQRTLRLIILPTRNCNFRCLYCYEAHENKVMTDEYYYGIIAMIQKKQMEGYNSLNISWFGGEPLLEYDAICWFMNYLHEHFPALTISGSMTTNGYLLSLERLKRLAALSIKHFQITVDGLKETHDQARVLKNGSGTWDTIVNNLINASQSDIDFSIGIRTNFTEDMFPQHEHWVSFLHDTFGHDSRFGFHFEAVKNLGIANDLAVFNRFSTINIINDMGKVSIQKGVSMPLITKMTRPCGAVCYAADPNCFVIDYDGSIKKCTVELDAKKNIVGHIDKDGIKDFDYINYSWWTFYDVYDICKKCSIYPICMGKKCPSSYLNEKGCETIRALYKIKMEEKANSYLVSRKSDQID